MNDSLTNCTPSKDVQKVKLLDGGMGYSLIRSGVQRTHLFSALALADEQYHDTVVKIHKQFIEVGSEIITTANYGVTPIFYQREFQHREVKGKKIEVDANDEEFGWKTKMRLHVENAGKLARKSANEYSSIKHTKVYACIPPVENFRPSIVKKYLAENRDDFDRFYEMLVEVLDPYVDGYMLETMNSWFEVEAILDVIVSTSIRYNKQCQIAGESHPTNYFPDKTDARQFSSNPFLTAKPIGISFYPGFPNIEDKPSPESTIPFIIKNLISYKHKHNVNIQFFGLNCAPLKETNRALEIIKQRDCLSLLNRNQIELCVYPNCVIEEETKSKSTYNRDDKKYEVSGEEYDKFFESNIALPVLCHDIVDVWCRGTEYGGYGVSMVGGCCGFSPEHMKKVANALGKHHKGEKQSLVIREKGL